MLDEKWFAERNFFPIPPDEISGHVLYAHRDGRIMNRFGHVLKHAFSPAKQKRNNPNCGQVYPCLTFYNAYCHRLIGRTFLRKLRKGEVYDHINGDITDYSVKNLRVVTKAVNYRDGGFLRMLRNRGIDPKMYPQSFLLRYFTRLARKKARLSRWHYRNLTRTDLLKLLVGPEYKVGDPNAHMDFEMSNHCEI